LWNTIQLLHTMFALYKELKKRCKKIVRAFWKKLCCTEVMHNNLLDLADVTKEVTQHIGGIWQIWWQIRQTN
jgi:hypothetical protein